MNLREIAVRTLCNLVQTEYACNTVVSGKLLQVPDVIGYCSDSNESIATHGSTILLKITEFSLKNVDQQAVFDIVIALLDHCEQQVRDNVRKCFRYLVQHEVLRSQLLDTERHVLVRLANDLLDAPQSIGLFGELAMGSTTECHVLIELGVLHKLAALLSLWPESAIENEIAWMVSNIEIDSPQHANDIADAGLIAPMTRLLVEQRENRVHVNAAHSVWNALQSVDHERIARANRLVPIGTAILARLRTTDHSNYKLREPLIHALETLFHKDRPHATITTEEFEQQVRDWLETCPTDSKLDSIRKLVAISARGSN
jgi:hypothetical protein